MRKVTSEKLEIKPIEKPIELKDSELNANLIETSSFINVIAARTRYNVTGAGLCAAVLDTGIRPTHVDFVNKIKAQKNFTADNGGDPNNARDGHGHGTNVSGIIAANGINKGIAPKANLAALKVLPNQGGGSFAAIANALDWILSNHRQFNITVVNLSLGDSNNYQSDNAFQLDVITQKIKAITAKNIAVVIAAGNDFYAHGSSQGMSFPGILRECVSVGAVYDSIGNGYSYQSGAVANSTKPGQITPFSQRLHDTKGGVCRTDIFSPGAPITSSGYTGDRSYSVQQGTSQATPVTAGVILLMQELYQKLRPTVPQSLPALPPVKLLVEWLRNGGVSIIDGDDEDDNVTNTGLTFKRIDAYEALRQVRKYFVDLLAFGE